MRTFSFHHPAHTCNSTRGRYDPHALNVRLRLGGGGSGGGTELPKDDPFRWLLSAATFCDNCTVNSIGTTLLHNIHVVGTVPTTSFSRGASARHVALFCLGILER
jgi:hypothetical protein